MKRGAPPLHLQKVRMRTFPLVADPTLFRLERAARAALCWLGFGLAVVVPTVALVDAGPLELCGLAAFAASLPIAVWAFSRTPTLRVVLTGDSVAFRSPTAAVTCDRLTALRELDAVAGRQGATLAVSTTESGIVVLAAEIDSAWAPELASEVRAFLRTCGWRLAAVRRASSRPRPPSRFPRRM